MTYSQGKQYRYASVPIKSKKENAGKEMSAKSQNQLCFLEGNGTKGLYSDTAVVSFICDILLKEEIMIISKFVCL